MILESANKYIARGFAVVPIPPRQKGPVLDGWQKLRIDSPEGWFQSNSNIGVILGSGLICVDLDHPLAVELADQFLPPTGMIAGRTNGGKTHWFYRVPGEFKKVQFVSECKQKMVEILGDGQQVVVGPSVHPSGDIYDNLEGEPATVEAAAIVEACRLLSMRCFSILGMQPKQPKPAKNTSTNWTGQATDLRETLLDHGSEIFSDGETKDGCAGYFVRCPRESSHTTKNGLKDCMVWTGPGGGWQARCLHTSCGIDSWAEFRAALDPLWVDEELLDFSEFMVDDPKCVVIKSEDCTPPAPIPKRRMPSEVFNVGGIIGRMLEHNARTSLGPMPEIALGGALALMSVITGHKVKDFRNLRTNLYVICLAPSGAGKDDSRKANKRILLKLGHHNMVAPTKIKSSAGMVSALVKNNPSLFQLDELSQVLRTMRDPDRNPHMSDVLTVLLEAWSETTGIYEPGAYADSSKNPIIDQPHLVLYGTSVAANFWPSLTKSNMSDGLVGRLLVFEHDGYPDDSDGGDPEDWNESLLAEVQSWCDFQPPATGNMKSPNPVLLPHTEDALDRYMNHRRAINARKDENEIRAALWRRCNEKVGKLAMLSACSRNPPVTGSLPRIELSDVNWGIQVANWLTNNMLERSRLLVSESIHEANLNRILAAMPDWTRKEKVGQAVRSIRADERDKIIRYAISDEIIEARQVETGGRLATEYRAAQGFNP